MKIINLNVAKYIEQRRKTEHFLNLVAVASADDLISPPEFEFLMAYGKSVGFEDDQLQFLCSKESEIEFMAEESISERERQLTDYIMMAMADGNLCERELDICNDLRVRLNLTKSRLKEIIDRVNTDVYKYNVS